MIKCLFLVFLVSLIVHSLKAIDINDTSKVSKPDSVSIEKKGQVYLATNFQQLINFHNNTNINLDIMAKLNLVRNKRSTIYRSRQEFNAEIAFTKFVDSIIDIRDDEIEFKSNWEFRLRSFVNSININLKSQLTNSYQYTFIKNEFRNVKSKQPLLPFIVSIGTGFNFTLKKNNFINLSPVDIKTTFLSEQILYFYPGYQKINPHLFYFPELGISITTSFYKIISNGSLIWKNNSRIFLKGPTKNDATIYSKNIFLFEINKWINISFENQLIYDPIYNYKLQLRNELVLGVSFKK